MGRFREGVGELLTNSYRHDVAKEDYDCSGKGVGRDGRKVANVNNGGE